MLNPSSRKQPFLIWCVVFPIVAISLENSVSFESSHAVDATKTNPATMKADKFNGSSGRVLGYVKANCKECHASEVAAWMKTRHYRADIDLYSDKAKEYSSRMGIDVARLRKNSMCLDCHGTKTADADGANIRALDYGVSCSSCHGGSGGDRGWLSSHYSFHESKPTTTDQETSSHRKIRLERCDKAGMIRPVNVYRIAKNCLSCHIISNQKLVATGHAIFDFETDLLSIISGEVRHNFQQDQRINRIIPTLWAKRTGGSEEPRKRMVFLVGLLVELEICVTNLSNVRDGEGRSDFAKANAKRVKWDKELLEELLLYELKDNAPGELTAFLDAVDSIKLSTRNFQDAAGAKKALTTISKKAKAFSENHDGSKLGAIDDIMYDHFEPRGLVFQPGQSP